MSRVNDNPDREELGFGDDVERAVGLGLNGFDEYRFNLQHVALVKASVDPNCKIITDDKDDC